MHLNYAFKTPTLRSVALRAPYMNNASQATLDDVVRFYEKGGAIRPLTALASVSGRAGLSKGPASRWAGWPLLLLYALARRWPCRMLLVSA